MVNYTNSKVYKIWSAQGDKIYVGSTTKQYLSQRMDKHRSDYKRWKDGKTNMITSFKLFDEYGVNNCFIELLETKECNSKDELHKIEGKYIRELECVNKLNPYRTEIEIKEYQKKYHEDNKEQLNEKMKQYYLDNKSQICEQTKEYRENHKDQISEYHKQFYIENKNKILEKHSQIFSCECGKSYTHGHKSRHLISSRHIKYTKSQEVKPEDGAE